MGKDPYNFYNSWQEVKVLYEFTERKLKKEKKKERGFR